ncbi:MAG: hypothetical protein DRP78_07290, partial [Candidatus Omnitrophota bacterium]
MKENKKTIFQDVCPTDKTYKEWDMLGFNFILDNFLHVLREIEPPMTIGLYGQWGSGKTSMLQGLAEELKKEHCFVVSFDAWKYRKEQDLMLPLLCKIRNTILLQKKEPLDKIPVVLEKIFFNLTTQMLKNKTGVDFHQLMNDGKNRYETYVDNVDQIEGEYKNFIEDLVKDKKLYVFIDNLDRCLPDIVVNLLEDISSFLSIKGVPCVYCLVMDKNNVIKAINHRYPDFNGVHYLEKIVQIGLSMPKLGDGHKTEWRQFFQKRYMKAINSEHASLFGHDSISVFKELEKIKGIYTEDGLLNNARRIERFINKWLVLCAMKRIGHTEDVGNVCLYVFGILLKEYFPVAYNEIKD